MRQSEVSRDLLWSLGCLCKPREMPFTAESDWVLQSITKISPGPATDGQSHLESRTGWTPNNWIPSAQCLSRHQLKNGATFVLPKTRRGTINLAKWQENSLLYHKSPSSSAQFLTFTQSHLQKGFIFIWNCNWMPAVTLVTFKNLSLCFAVNTL